MYIIRGYNNRPVCISKNLAGVRRYASRNKAAMITLTRTPLTEGWMNILFENGSFFRCKFRSFKVLCAQVSPWAAAHDTPLFVNGYPRKLEYHRTFDTT